MKIILNVRIQKMTVCLWLTLTLGSMLVNAESNQATASDGHEQSKSTSTSNIPPQKLQQTSTTAVPLHTICQQNIACYKQHLENTVTTQGPSHALQVIEHIVTKDRVALREAHNLTHHVGRVSYQHLKDVTKVMAQCTAAHQSGCYHGALEAYLTSKSHVNPKDVVAICDKKLEQEKGRFAYFNCFHGLGHGLTMHLNHDRKQALDLCDTLLMRWDRESCYGGVFMETVVTGIRGGHQHSGHHGKKDMSHTTKLIDPKNPLYPCSDLDKKYQRECYMMQTSIILHLTHYDLVQAFRECDKAPKDMIPTCYQSMGRDISGHTLRDIKQSIRLCGLGLDAYQHRCFIGVVKNFINVSGRASDNAFDFCRQAPAQHKKDCHVAIGEEFLTLYAKPQRRSRECARSEAKHVRDCRQGARLRSDPS